MTEVLNLADQAKLEGRLGRATSSGAVDAAATLIRIAYRFQVIARAQLLGAEALLPPDVLQHRRTWEREYCVALESRIARLESMRSPESLSALPASATIEVGEIAGGQPGAASSETNLTVELESYRRLPILLDALDVALSKILTAP